MPAMKRQPSPQSDEATLSREARRILRRMNEPGAYMAVARDLEQAAVLRDGPDGQTTRTAVADRSTAEAFALKDWISCRTRGRVTIYEITAAGRAKLKRILAEDETGGQPGMAEAYTPFGDQHRDMEWQGDDRSERIRYNRAESPLAILARRRDKDGKPFLSADLVAAGERLREDFEISQMGPRVAQNWDRFLTGGDRGSFGSGGPGDGAGAARDRVANALRDLGPGLGDVVLRCCCFLEGMEEAEKKMGWSARSGKIVLRIALQRLKRHYEELGDSAGMIG
ncbi:DNA-binding protein [Rhodovulum sp. P5]|nr:DNA-binding protein [Rhodovulum sp. P5]